MYRHSRRPPTQPLKMISIDFFVFYDFLFVLILQVQHWPTWKYKVHRLARLETRDFHHGWKKGEDATYRSKTTHHHTTATPPFHHDLLLCSSRCYIQQGGQEKGDTCEACKSERRDFFKWGGGSEGNSCNGSSQGSTLINRKKKVNQVENEQ